MKSDFRVGDWLVRPGLRQLEALGDSARDTVSIEARSIDVLVELARHAGEIRSRQELLDAVWGDAFVTEEALSHSIWELRRALGDNARQPTYIQTVPKRGYRLIAPVSWLESDPGQNRRFRRLEKLGSGGMGVVWKAEDTRLHRTVALKYLPDSLSRDPVAKERLLREARIAASLDHPNICTLHELGETDDGRLFLVLAFCAGETLKTRLERGPLPWREAARIALGVAKGLKAAHAQGVIHRDVKPANLMLDGESVTILDFGIAQWVAGTRADGVEGPSDGTLHRSSEPTRSDVRADLRSLGRVLYELLAGTEQFRHPARALADGIPQQDPISLGKQNPGIPRALVVVLERLLTEDPDPRFESMDGLIEALESALEEAPSELPSGLGAALPDQRPESSKDPLGSSEANPSAGPSVAAAGEARLPGLQIFLTRGLGLLVLVLIVWGVSAHRASWFGPEPPRRVLVARPDLGEGSDNEFLRPVIDGVLVGTLNSLSTLRGIEPLDPDQARDAERSATAMARAAGADEVLMASVTERRQLALVTLRRVRGADGGVLWSDTFETQIDIDSTRPLASTLRTRIRRAFPEHPPRSGTLQLEARDEDYRSYLEIRQRLDRGAPPGDRRDLELLDSVIATSPRFFEAYLLWADLVRLRIRDRRETDDLAAALRRTDQAAELAPDDPRPTRIRFQLELAVGRLEDARRTLGQLESQLAGQSQLLDYRAQMARAEGDLDTARSHFEQAIEVRPAWSTLYLLADLEYRAGKPDAARRHLQRLLRIVPGHRSGLSKLAEVELFYGDLSESEALYRQLATRDPRQRNAWTNLGITQYLQGDFENAAAAYHQALAVAPGHPLVLLNLAGSEFAAGRAEVGRGHCLRVVEQLERRESQGPLGAIDALMKAHCLARIDRQRQAVAIAQDTFQAHPQNAEVAYQAAVVFALSGQRLSALAAVEKASDLGVGPRWFQVPELAALATEPVRRETPD